MHPLPEAERESSIRVAQLIESDGPGGAESVVLALANGLRKRDVHVSTVVFPGGEGWLSGKLRSEGHSVFAPSISRNVPVDIGLVFRLSRWIIETGINVLHAHELMMGFYAGLAGLVANVPHVITMHGGTYYASARHRRLALRWSAKRAHSLVGVADTTRDRLISQLSIPPSMVSVVPNGVDYRRGDRNRGRASLGITEETRLILAVGNLYEVKGHRTLISAASIMATNQSLPPWQIAIAGRGPEKDALIAQIAEANLQDRVKLLGLRDDIPDLLAAADSWVMPSNSEGLPMALLEAMMAGVPCVCSAVGGIPNLVVNEETGWLVSPGDFESVARALSRVLDEPQRAQIIASRGRDVALKTYGVDVMINQYLSKYQEANYRFHVRRNGSWRCR